MPWFFGQFRHAGVAHGTSPISLGRATLGQSTLMRISLRWPRLVAKKAKREDVDANDKAGRRVAGRGVRNSGRGHDRAGAGRGGQLSQQADPRHRPVRGRRRQRHLRAPGRPEIVGDPRPAGDQREQARRRRPDRRRICDEPAARRLHAVHRRQRRDVGRRGRLSEPVLSSDQDVHSAVDDRELPAHPGGAARSSGQERQGTGRVGEEEPGQGELRFDLAGLHHGERTAQAQERHARAR